MKDKEILSNLSNEEKGVLAIMRLKKFYGRKEIRKTFILGRLEIEFHWRSKKNLMGRFGGGWNWALGFKGSGRTTIINLLICSLRFHFRKREKDKDNDR